MNSRQIKKFFVGLNIPVRVRTVPCKSQIIQVWIANSGKGSTLEYKHEFPERFCKIANGVIYGSNTSVGQQSYTNIANRHSITMTPEQWERATTQFFFSDSAKIF